MKPRLLPPCEGLFDFDFLGHFDDLRNGVVGGDVDGVVEPAVAVLGEGEGVPAVGGEQDGVAALHLTDVGAVVEVAVDVDAVALGGEDLHGVGADGLDWDGGRNTIATYRTTAEQGAEEQGENEHQEISGAAVEGSLHAHHVLLFRRELVVVRIFAGVEVAQVVFFKHRLFVVR